MKALLLSAGAAVLALGLTGSADAGDRWYGGRGHGHRHGHGHHHGRRFHDPGHFDYFPGGFQRHRGHFHYVPPHVDYHWRGRRYEVIPDPFGFRPGYVSPWHHHHR